MKTSLVLISVFILSYAGFAQTNEECLDCHSDNELTKFIDDTTEVSLYIDGEKYGKSLHGDLECINCHEDVEDVEHEPELAKVQCGNCHEDTKEEYLRSIHAKAKLSGDACACCIDCHGSHYVLPADEPESMTYALNIQITCARCHESKEVLAKLGMHGTGPATAYQNSVHDILLHEDPEAEVPTCNDCHGDHEIYTMGDPRSRFNKLNRAETCGECHEDIKDDYYKSIHWQAVERGHFESPTCNDCHGEHHIVSPQDAEATTNRLHLSSQICANCHSSQTMMQRFGLDHERFATYSKTYHGLAVLKGSTDAANCTSCHEVHAIRTQSDPSSTIHPDNLQKTCGQCHEEVTAEFINIPAHPTDMEIRNPYAFYAKNIYIWLLLIVVGGMVLHNLVIFVFYLRRKKRALKSENTVQRFQSFEVYQHILLILSFFMLVVTGFALKFPQAMWVKFLVSIGMDESLRALLHRIAAVVLIFISFVQMFYFILSRKGRREIWALRPEISDVTGFFANMRYYLGMSNQRPKFGRWDYTEKAEYLALIWGTAVMALTGLVLWFPEIAMTLLPAWIFEFSEVIHYYEAWLATLAIIVWHWFFVIFHPEKYPMSLTWMNGRITEEELKHHHPLEHEQQQVQTDFHNRPEYTMPGDQNNGQT